MNYYIKVPSTPQESIPVNHCACSYVANWIIQQIRQNSENGNHKLAPETIDSFKEQLNYFIEKRFSELGCCNLRTTNPETNRFCKLAIACKIPLALLPSNISIIIPSVGNPFYYYKESVFRHYL